MHNSNNSIIYLINNCSRQATLGRDGSSSFDSNGFATDKKFISRQKVEGGSSNPHRLQNQSSAAIPGSVVIPPPKKLPFQGEELARLQAMVHKHVKADKDEEEVIDLVEPTADVGRTNKSPKHLKKSELKAAASPMQGARQRDSDPISDSDAPRPPPQRQQKQQTGGGGNNNVLPASTPLGVFIGAQQPAKRKSPPTTEHKPSGGGGGGGLPEVTPELHNKQATVPALDVFQEQRGGFTDGAPLTGAAALRKAAAVGSMKQGTLFDCRKVQRGKHEEQGDAMEIDEIDLVDSDC